MWGELRDIFPDKESRMVANEVVLTQNAGVMNQTLKSDERVLLFTGDKNRYVQIGTRLVSIHNLKHFEAWERDFEQAINGVFDAFTAFVNVDKFQRIGLRFINRIEIPKKSDLEDYFAFRPLVDQDLKDNIKNLIVGCVFEFRNRDACRVQLSDVPSEKGNNTYILDLDYFLLQPKAVSAGEAIQWVNDAYRQIVQIFDKCTTDKLKKTFGVT
jgi:uncharacterized protein (TIGR04255 family)